MAEVLSEQRGNLTVDRKLVADDRFDDVTVERHGWRSRTQFKHSSDASRLFEIEDLTTERKSLRLDRLLDSYLQAGTEAADEYRVAVTWQAIGLGLRPYMEPFSTARTAIPGSGAQTHKLALDAIWPDDAEPRWDALRGIEVTRKDFARFLDRLYFDVNLPQFSGDFNNPGPLESVLIGLLRDRVGIGRYPNQRMSVADTAEVLVRYAAALRAEGGSGSDKATVGLSDIEARIRIEKDFGRVAQRFPVDETLLVAREAAQQGLQTTVLEERTTLLVGQPGAGKSWSLDRLSKALVASGHLVAKHFCYLEPGDELVARRITVNAMWSNLMADLVDLFPSLREAVARPYAAGKEELMQLLPKAVEASGAKRVVLIVDGVDHISRVLTTSPEAAPGDADIVEQLASLVLPRGVSLVVGTQDGQHLQPLHDVGAKTIPAPAWVEPDIRSLVENIGIGDYVPKEASKRPELEQRIVERADGNPLYATYLCRTLIESYRTGEAVDAVAMVDSAPTLSGNIANYYSHLIATKNEWTVIVAEVLSAIDFGVTEHELQDIVGFMPTRLREAVRGLRPLLVEASAQGGIRIYHESFRRFVLERISAEGKPLSEVVEPVRIWLERRGFYDDPRAFHFLLQVLRRGGHDEEILRLIGTTYVSNALAAGYAERAISANIGTAIDVAEKREDLPSLVRCAHLLASVQTRFSERFYEELYGQTFAKLRGIQALTRSLLFEGRPTYTREHGLILCQLCDDLGESPPWEAYLQLKARNDQSHDQDRKLSLAIAEFHGALRVFGVASRKEKLIRNLQRRKRIGIAHLQGLFRAIGKIGGAYELDEMRPLLEAVEPAAEVLDIEAIVAFQAEGRDDSARSVARLRISKHPSSVAALVCIRAGAELPDWAGEEYSAVKIDPLSSEFRFNEGGLVDDWINRLQISAWAGSRALTEERERLDGLGWFRLWLQYAIDVAIACAAEGRDSVLPLFRRLASDTHPFRGSPRACDLYSLRTGIHETIAQGLSLLKLHEWEEALGLLSTISQGTTTYLQNSRSGPLTSDALIELVQPYLAVPEVRPFLLTLFEAESKKADGRGELYEVHAEHEMKECLGKIEAGDSEAAERHWQKAAVYLGAYGYRKDVLLLDLIDAFPSFQRTSEQLARQLAYEVMPLVWSAIDHTDGKETRHFPNSWFESLAWVDHPSALVLLGDALVRRGGCHHWMIERAFEDALEACVGKGDPLLRFRAYQTIPFDGKETALRSRIETCREVLNADLHAGLQCLKQLAASVQGDPPGYSSEAYGEVRALAAEYKLSVPFPLFEPPRKKDAEDPGTRARQEDQDPLPPLFSPEATPFEVMSWLRNNGYRASGRDEPNVEFVDALANHLSRLEERAGSGSVDRCLQIVAEECDRWNLGRIFKQLATLLEANGALRSACCAFVMAYTRTRGKGGYGVLADSKGIESFAEAFRLSRTQAMRVLAREVAVIARDRYPYGLAQHLIELLMSLEDERGARAVWDSAFGVLQHRLPLTSEETVNVIFPSYVPEAFEGLTTDEAMFWLLAARVSHPELRRKTAAMAGIFEELEDAPTYASFGLKRALSAEEPLSSVRLLLHSLLESEPEPFNLSRNLKATLEKLQDSTDFSIQFLSRELVGRISDVPTQLSDGSQPHLEQPLPDRRRRSILSLDATRRVEKMTQVWPDAAVRVTDAFEATWSSSKTHEQRSQARHRIASSHSDEVPETPLLFWEDELFEQALNQALLGLAVESQAQSEWSIGKSRAAYMMISPSVSLAVRQCRSRGVRGDFPPASDFQEDRQEAAESELDEEGVRWFRIASFEREFTGREYDSGKPKERVVTYQGVDRKGLDVEDKRWLPLGQGDLVTWYEWPEGETSASLFGQPVAILQSVKDILGARTSLALNPMLTSRLRLFPSENMPLELMDDNGKRAVFFRSWRMQPMGDEINQETDRLLGGELMVREDVFYRITLACGHSLVGYRRVSRLNQEHHDEAEDQADR